MSKAVKVKPIKKEVKVKEIEANVYSNIYASTDYDMVKNINTNRNLNVANYNKLLRSMQEEQLVMPICLNENMEIIDGQHRFFAAKELGLPFYYYIQEGYREAQMKRANLVGSTWNKNDFLNMYINEGDETYRRVKELMDKYKIVISDMIKIMGVVREVNYRELGLMFEEGTMVLSEADFIDIEQFLDSLYLFKDFKHYNRSKFISAFLELYFHAGYNHKHMKERYSKRSAVLVPQLTRDAYLTLLANKIYSFGTSKYNIYYDPDRKTLYTPN